MSAIESENLHFSLGLPAEEITQELLFWNMHMPQVEQGTTSHRAQRLFVEVGVIRHSEAYSRVAELQRVNQLRTLSLMIRADKAATSAETNFG